MVAHSKSPLIVVAVLSTLLALFFLVFFSSRSSLSVSALETSGYVKPYWDRNCTRPAASIDWGILTIGSTKKVSIYVRNEGNEACFLAVTSSEFTPVNASKWLEFSSSYEKTSITPGQVKDVMLGLTALEKPVGISTFSFVICVEGDKYPLGDVNRDMTVDIRDVAVVSAAFDSMRIDNPGDPRYNQYWHPTPCIHCPHTPDADANRDGKIDIKDLAETAANYGTHQ